MEWAKQMPHPLPLNKSRYGRNKIETQTTNKKRLVGIMNTKINERVALQRLPNVVAAHDHK